MNTSFQPWMLGIFAVLGGAVLASDTPARPSPPNETIRSAVERHSSASLRPFDEPDAAAELAWRKRQGPGPDFNTAAAYRRAREHMDAMPRYSSRLGVEIERRAPATVAGVAAFATKRLLGTWETLGPGNIGGRTRALLIHPENHDIMYTAGVSGGVWKTTDRGNRWFPLADEIANIAVNSMAMHPDDPETLFIGTGEGYFREEVRGTWLPLRGAGIFVTRDGGASWALLESTTGEDFHWVNDLVVSSKDPDVIYAATRTGVHVSSDGGASWEHDLVSNRKGGCLDLAVRDTQARDWVFASCGTLDQATVYRRKMASGTSWEPVLSQPGMGRTTLAIAPSSQNVIYALSASNDPGPNGLYEQGLFAVFRSGSGGDAGSWEVRVDNSDPNKLNTLLLTNPVAASYRDCGWASSDYWIPMGWYCNVIAVDPTNPNIVWAAGVDLFRSDNGGRDWGLASYWWASGIDSSFAHADQHAIVFHPDFDGVANTRMYAAGDGGIFSTDNPYATVATAENEICDPWYSQVRFRDHNTNLGITQFYHGVPFPGGDAYIGGTQDNGTLIGLDAWGSDGWQHVLGGDGGYNAVDPTSPNIVYAESQRFGFAKSTDGGQSFSDADSGVNDGGFLFITPFTMDPNEPQRLWTGGHRLWRTDNAAESWEAASVYPLGPGQVSALAVSPHNSQEVVVGTSDGDIYRSQAAIYTTGVSRWGSSRPRDGFVTSLAVDPSSQEVIYATYAGFGGAHVWRSEDFGETWEPLDGSGASALPDIPAHSVVVDPTDANRIYLGTDLGVFTSTDRGRTWAVENTGFANAVTEWLALGNGPDDSTRLFAFTHGRGAWRVDLAPAMAAPRRPGGRVTP
ncbi:MAG: hypothetical protein V2I67_20440 [Thermoanaerobaculales bacterium]|jgi:photosystem II stability/assembly factor-like uncharacterized protein|nr:hypothetical protein [Thermoanaerobaculales bacterium]